MFISHDLATVRQISHSVSVLHRGVQVDNGATGELFALPGSDYTRQLIEAIPGRQFNAEPPEVEDAIYEQ